jgi:putative metallohydrolase (TIGR04338 family)
MDLMSPSFAPTPLAPGPVTGTQVTQRRPRDAQRRRVYLAETPLPSSPLPGLDACARFVDRVVGTLWWHERFPERDLGGVPRLRPGQGARQAFYREEETGPTITLPRRYRTKAVVLHELTHWALGIDSGLPHHGRTFARVLLDALGEFCGPERAAELAASYREHGVHVARPPRPGPDGRLHYGWDERLRLNKGRLLAVSSWSDGVVTEVVARFDGYERGSSVLRFTDGSGHESRIATNTVWSVRDVG